MVATFKNRFGQETDPSLQEIIISQPDGQPFLKITSPERLEMGSYRLSIQFPTEAPEGKWLIRWTATIDGEPTTEITEVMITKQVTEPVALQRTIIVPKDVVITFVGEDYEQ